MADGYIRRPYQVLIIERKTLKSHFWDVGFYTLEEAKKQEHYFNCAEHWNNYIFYTLKLPDSM